MALGLVLHNAMGKSIQNFGGKTSL